MQIQPVVDRNVAVAQRVGLTPVKPGDRADFDTGASPGGPRLPYLFRPSPVLPNHPAVTPLDNRFLDQAATFRKARYTSHLLLEIVLSSLVSVVPPSLSPAASHGASTILMVTGLRRRVVQCNKSRPGARSGIPGGIS